MRGGQKPGTERPAEVVQTEIGEAFCLARQTKPVFRMWNAGESVLRGRLVDTLPEIGGPALVIYEDVEDASAHSAGTSGGIRGARDDARRSGVRGRTRSDPIRGGRMERDHQASGRSQSEARRAGDTPDARTLTILRRYAAGEISARQAAPDTCSVTYTALVNASVWCSITTDGVRA